MLINTTKIDMALEACGLTIHFSITGGEVHDCKEAPVLVAKLLLFLLREDRLPRAPMGPGVEVLSRLIRRMAFRSLSRMARV